MGQVAPMLPCGHGHHGSCFDPWIMHSYLSTQQVPIHLGSFFVDLGCGRTAAGPASVATGVA